MQKLALPETPPPLPDEHRRRGGRVLIVVNAVFAFLIFALLLFVMPVFAAMFKDFGAKLPAPTQVLIDLSNFLRSWWWLLGAPLVGVVMGGYMLLERCAKPAAVGRYLVGLLVAQILFIGFAVVALLLPIFQLGAVAGGL